MFYYFRWLLYLYYNTVSIFYNEVFYYFRWMKLTTYVNVQVVMNSKMAPVRTLMNVMKMKIFVTMESVQIMMVDIIVLVMMAGMEKIVM